MRYIKKDLLIHTLVFVLISVSSILPVLAAPDYLQELDAQAYENTRQLYMSRPLLLSQMEYLNRGVVAVPASEGTLVTWRLLGTDSPSIKFNVYRDGVKICSTEKTNYFDKGYTKTSEYMVIPVIDGKEISDENGSAVTLEKNYLSIPVTEREGNYDINDASVGDLDGDGEYEIVVRRDPENMDISTRGPYYPLIEAYKLDGTHLWTIDIGPNEVNTIDINFLVYDFDGDGKAEIATRSFEGTKDGLNNVIGDTNNDGITNYEYSLITFPDRQYLSEGPEFLSIYEGATGKELARTELLPARENIYRWSSYKDLSRNVKRASHFLFAVAYLDGITPSIVHVRGAWDGVGAAAWNFKNGNLTHLWTHEVEKSSINNLYGAGYHSLAVADIDFDGKDEILSGAMAIDDNGSTLYATNVNGVKLGHGDAFDVAKMDPDYDGYLVWACHETPNLPTNIELHDARTGQVLMGYTKGKDTGRSRAADIDPTNRGWEVWGSTATPLQNLKGEVLPGVSTKNAPVSMNMKLYWDGDLLSELVDQVTITKWDWKNRKEIVLLTATDCAYNGGTKGQNCLTADIFGDWRDEVIFRTADNKEMRIYTTNIPTDYRMPTLMHDRTYREAIAWQNNHYNQPANVSFYLGAETQVVPVPEIYVLKNGEKIINPVYQNNSKEHKFISIRTNDLSMELLYDKNSTDNTVSLNMYNTGSSNVSGQLVIACYNDDNKLLECKVIPAEIQANSIFLYEYAVNNYTDTSKISAFYLSDFNSIAPLCNSVSIEYK